MKHNPKKYKKQLLISLERNLGIVTSACKEVGIGRDTFYRYYNSDEDFKKSVDDINEITIDFVETQLLKKIKDGSERSILFYMKYKGKKRGYSSSMDITTDGEKLPGYIIQIVNPNDDNTEGKI